MKKSMINNSIVKEFIRGMNKNLFKHKGSTQLKNGYGNSNPFLFQKRVVQSYDGDPANNFKELVISDELNKEQIKFMKETDIIHKYYNAY